MTYAEHLPQFPRTPPCPNSAVPRLPACDRDLDHQFTSSPRFPGGVMGRSRSAYLVAGLLVAASGCDGDGESRIFARFDLSSPANGPFPSDIFTTKDTRHNTGRRVNYPFPDCEVRPSDCEDINLVNTMDGWGIQPQLAIPFSGDIDPASVSSESVFVISLPPMLPAESPVGQVVGINQMAWDPPTRTLYAEVDAILDQHRRYAVIVTDGITDTEGRPVNATADFTRLDQVPSWYAQRLREAFEVAEENGISEGEIVAASVFSTQSVTSVMERIRDRIKSEVPAPADFRLVPGEKLSVFAAEDVVSVVLNKQMTVDPPEFEPMPINLAPLNAIPGSVGTIAYGRYVSPEYLVRPGEYIPAVGTRTGIPPVQAQVPLYFTLYLPSGPQPESGWPIAIIGPGATQAQHGSTTAFGSTLAAHGIATIGINSVGQGGGALSELSIELADGETHTIPDAGREIDQDGDNIIAEGGEAAPPRRAMIRFSHAYLQTVIDYMQLVRVIEAGMDVDGDDLPDIDPSRIHFVGASAGSMIGTIFMALEPSVRVGALVVAPGVSPEHDRWMPLNRPTLGSLLEVRDPSLINEPGVTEINGVPVDGPYFNENKPLRDQPIVINDVVGAIEIQHVFELEEMVAGAGTTPAFWSRYLRETPLSGVDPKSVTYLFANGDQVSVNPGTSALIRAGNLEDRTCYYRHDLAYAQDPTLAKNPHAFAALVVFPNPRASAIARGAQQHIAVFLASDGATTIHPEPAEFFEVPIEGPLPETLNFIP